MRKYPDSSVSLLFPPSLLASNLLLSVACRPQALIRGYDKIYAEREKEIALPVIASDRTPLATVLVGLLLILLLMSGRRQALAPKRNKRVLSSTFDR